MMSTTSLRTVDKLRRLFTAYGIWITRAGDNGSQFILQEFQPSLSRLESSI